MGKERNHYSPDVSGQVHEHEQMAEGGLPAIWEHPFSKPVLMMQADEITNGRFLVTLKLWVSWESSKCLVRLPFSNRTLMNAKCNLHSLEQLP